MNNKYRILLPVCAFLLLMCTITTQPTSASVIAPWSFPVIDGVHSPFEWDFHQDSLSLYRITGTNSTPVPETIQMEVGFANNPMNFSVAVKLFNILLPFRNGSAGQITDIEYYLYIVLDDNVIRERAVEPNPVDLLLRGDWHVMKLRHQHGSYHTAAWDSCFYSRPDWEHWAVAFTDTFMHGTKTFNFSAEGTPGQIGNVSFETNFVFGSGEGWTNPALWDIHVSDAYYVHIDLHMYAEQLTLGNFGTAYSWPTDTQYDYENISESLFSQWYEVIPAPQPLGEVLFPYLVIGTVIVAAATTIAVCVYLIRRRHRTYTTRPT